MSDKQEEVAETAEVEEALSQSEGFTAEGEMADEEVEVLSPEELVKLLEQTQAKADEAQDKLVRSHAEIDNLKRRHSQELEKAHKYGLDKFVSELLSVWDSLELGTQAAKEANADIAKLLEGNDLTVKMLGDVMAKFGVNQINPEGEQFNPELHQAISMVPNEELPNNTVMTVVQKGYGLNGRLVRPAMVMVTQGGPAYQAPADGIDEQA